MSSYGNFRHVTYTVSGSNISLYVNGALVNSATGAVDFSPSNTRDMYIGTEYVHGGACLDFWGQLDGVVDELRIYNRVLSDSEIQQLFSTANDTTPPAYTGVALNVNIVEAQTFHTSDIVATLTFDEALVNNLADLAALKAAITFAPDGTNFSALAAGDAVAISGSTVTVTFAAEPTGITANKLKIAANSLKDAAGNVVASATTTAAWNGMSGYVYRRLSSTKAKDNDLLNNWAGAGESGDTTVTHLLYAQEDYHFTVSSIVEPLTQMYSTGQPLGSRIPIILVHGWQGDKNTTTPQSQLSEDLSAEKHFENLISFFNHHGLKDRYKLYVYKYPSYKHATFNALQLKGMIDSHAELSGKSNLVFIAHSMGTIVTRTMFEEHGFDPGRLGKFISLDGVHHGSPAAVPGWVTGNTAPKDLHTFGANDIQWDGYDGIFLSPNYIGGIDSGLQIGWRSYQDIMGDIPDYSVHHSALPFFQLFSQAFTVMAKSED